MLKKTWRLYKDAFSGISKEVWLLALVSLINRSGTMVVPFLTIYLKSKMGFSYLEIGTIMSVFGVGSLIGTYSGGKLTDKIGFYPVLFWSLFLGGLSFILLGFLTSFLAWCIAITILGMVGEAFRPAIYTGLASYSEGSYQTRGTSLIRLAVNLGISVGPAIGGFIAYNIGFAGLFWADGLTCIAAALFMRIYIPYKRNVKTNSSESSRVILGISAYKDFNFLIFIGFLIFTSLGFMQFFLLIPMYYKEHFMFNESQIGLILALNGMLIVLFEMPLVHRLENKIPKLMLIALGSGLLGLSFLILIPGYTVWYVAVFSLTILTLGEIFNMPFANSFAMNQASEGRRGQYMALYAMAYSIAHIIAPGMGSFFIQNYGYSSLWTINGLLCMISMVGFYFMQKNPRLKQI
jgi:predicted MFS family arabinose efflux permease